MVRFSEALDADPDLQIVVEVGMGEAREQGGIEDREAEGAMMPIHSPLAAAVYAERAQCRLRMHQYAP